MKRNRADWKPVTMKPWLPDIEMKLIQGKMTNVLKKPKIMSHKAKIEVIG